MIRDINRGDGAALAMHFGDRLVQVRSSCRACLSDSASGDLRPDR
jgi:hypothetical protein